MMKSMEIEDAAVWAVKLSPLFNTFHELQELCQREKTQSQCMKLIQILSLQRGCLRALVDQMKCELRQPSRLQASEVCT